jgi:hypothetical protein
MAFIWLQARAELRVKWRAFVVLAVVVGLGGGVALAAFAGARRTEAAMPQFVAYRKTMVTNGKQRVPTTHTTAGQKDIACPPWWAPVGHRIPPKGRLTVNRRSARQSRPPRHEADTP